MFTRRTLLAGIMAASLRAAPRPRAGCQTRAYGSPIRDRKKLLNVWTDLAEAGYDGFETNFASLEDSFENPKPIAAELRARGLLLIGLHAAPRLHLETGVAEEIEKARRIARGVAAWNGRYLICSTAVSSATLPRWNENAQRLDKACRELGVVLCIHNHLQELKNNAEILRGALRGSELSAVLDLSYCSDAGLDAPAFFREQAPRIAAVHVRDHRDGEEVLLGEGKLQGRAIGQAMAETHWGGWAILEMNPRPGLASRDLIRLGRTYLKEQMGV